MAKKIAVKGKRPPPADEPAPEDLPVDDTAPAEPPGPPTDQPTPETPTDLTAGTDDEKYEEQGTLASGYMEGGPFQCQDCQHYSTQGSVCTHPVVIADPALAMRKRGDAMPVEPDACCRFVNPPEEKMGPVSEESAL